MHSRCCVASSLAACLSSTVAWAAPFALTPDQTLIVIDLSVPASLHFSVTIRADEIVGTGAVSGFSGVSIKSSDVSVGGAITASVLAPFRSAPFSNGTSGSEVAGLFGGQFVLPPSVPIQYSSELFVLSYTETAGTEREFQLRIRGRGGVFLAPNGQSLTPFEDLDEALIYVRVVVPSPGSWACALCVTPAMLRRRRVAPTNDSASQ